MRAAADAPPPLTPSTQVSAVRTGRLVRIANRFAPTLTFIFVLVISVIGSFQVFDQVYVMTPNGGPLFSTETVVSYIYYQGVTATDISYAATIGVVLFVIVFALTLIQLRVLRFRELE